MSLNIKTDEAHRMAQELAKLTGESVTAAVKQALRERLERIRYERAVGVANRLLAIGKDSAPRLRGASPSADHGDLLYDALGLPK